MHKARVEEAILNRKIDSVFIHVSVPAIVISKPQFEKYVELAVEISL